MKRLSTRLILAAWWRMLWMDEHPDTPLWNKIDRIDTIVGLTAMVAVDLILALSVYISLR